MSHTRIDDPWRAGHVRRHPATAAAVAAAFLGACAATPRAPRGEPQFAAPTATEGGAGLAAASAGAAPTAAPAAAPAAAQGDSAGGAAPAQSAGDGEGLAVHGSLSTRYRARTTGDARDQDVYEVLVLDVGDASRDPVTAHVMGRGAFDIDGQGDADAQATYPSLADTWDSWATGLLYEAYADVHDVPKLGALRVGRQLDFTTPEFAHFDGVSLVTDSADAWKMRGGAYGGVPVRLYDANAGEVMFGLWGEAQPWKDGRVRVDWMHVEDEDRFGANNNDLLGANIAQRLGEKARADLNYTRLEEEDRDLRLRGSWNDFDHDLVIQASWYRLLEAQGDFALEFDPFYASLQTFQPFDQYRVNASKGVNESLRVEGGFDLRRLEDSGDEGSYNRDYDRGWLSLVLLDLASLEGLSLTLTGDMWSSADQDTEAWGADLSRVWKDGLTLSLGSNYAMYKYDYFQNRERDDVRTWYFRARQKIDESWSLDAAYDFQDDDDDEQFHVLTLGVVWSF